MKKSSRRLLLVVMALVITLAVGTTSTYAWFTLTDIAKVENILLQVNVATGVQIAGGHPGKPGWTGNWFSNLSNYELLLANDYLDPELSAASDTVLDAADATAFLRNMQLVDLSPQLYSSEYVSGASGTPDTLPSWTNTDLTGKPFMLMNANGTYADYVYDATTYAQRYITSYTNGILVNTLTQADIDAIIAGTKTPVAAEIIDEAEFITAGSAGTYWVPLAEKNATAIASVDQRGYLAFDITLRAAKNPTTVNTVLGQGNYIPVYLKSSSTNVADATAAGVTSTNIPNFTGAPIPMNTFGLHPAIAADADIPANAANAARFGFVPYGVQYTSETLVDTTGTLPTFNYSSGELVSSTFYDGTDAAYARIYDPRHNQGYYGNLYTINNNLARQYYLYYYNITAMTGLDDLYFSNNTHYNADTNESAVLNAASAGLANTEFGRLYDTGIKASSSENYYQGSIRVYIWAEGKDGDCFNSIIGQMFNSQIAFTIPTIA